MAHLVRPRIVRYVDAEGRRCRRDTPGARKVVEKARKWYGKGIPGYPPSRKFPLASNKSAAQQKLAALVKSAERGEVGLEDETTKARLVALDQHLKEWRKVMEANPKSSAVQAAQQYQRAATTFAGCGWTVPQDIAADALQQYLAGRRNLPKAEGGISVRTSNGYLQACRQFCKWMVKVRRLPSNPLAEATYGNVRTDRKHYRRNLEVEEVERLFATVRNSPRDYRGLSGLDRMMLYHIGCATGFRRKELLALVVESFDLDASRPTATVPAAYTKNGKTAVQSLPASLVAPLREWLADKPSGTCLWPGTWWEKSARMLRLDLADAGIPYAVKGRDGTRYADFHALRHTYVTMVIRSGADAKTAQALARHADISLTLDHYTHIDNEAVAQAVERLPLPGQEHGPALTAEQAATIFAVGLACLYGHLRPGTATPLVVPLVVPMVVPPAAPDWDGPVRNGTELQDR